MIHTEKTPTGPSDVPKPRDWTRGYLRAAGAAVLVHIAVAGVLLFGHWKPEQLVNLGTEIYAVGVFAGAVFLVAYSVLARWWKTPIGLLFELIGIATVATGIVVLASLVLGTDYPGREIVRIVGYLLFTDATVGILITYLIERRHPKPVIPARRRNQKEPHP